MSIPAKKKIWITWHFQARSRNLAKALKLEIKECFYNESLWKRHFYSSLWTLNLLFKEKPSVVFIQYSFLLLLILFFYKIFSFNKRIIVVDCHTKALRRKSKGLSNYIFWSLKKLSFKAADLTIISNDGLIKDITQFHQNYILLPDIIPEIKLSDIKTINENYCVYVSSFAVDEPFTEMLEVSKKLKGKIKLYWTGKYPEKVKTLKSDYDNIVFTGYLNFNDYYNLIFNAQCIIALTYEEDCLQSGAYEALGVEVPLVTTETNALKNYFSTSAIYTKNYTNNIYYAILKAISEKNMLVSEIQKIKILRKQEYKSKIEKLISLINSFEY